MRSVTRAIDYERCGELESSVIPSLLKNPWIWPAGKTSLVAAIDCAGPPRRLQFDSMGVTVNLTHHFLIAMPTMADPHFANTLTYVCEHNPEGALGIVINKPIDMTLSALFEQINIPLVNAALRESPVHFGGPVQVDRGFVLHRPLGNWQSTLAIS